MPTKKEYDDDALVCAIAAGDRTFREIGEEFGLSHAYVWQISKGLYRKDLYPRIRALREAMLEETHRLAGRMATAAMARLGKLIAADVKPTPEVQRKAAADILRYALGRPAPGRDDPAPDPEPERQLTGGHLAKLSPETLRRVCQELGWEDCDD